MPYATKKRTRGPGGNHTESRRVGLTPTAIPTSFERLKAARNYAFYSAHEHDGTCFRCGKTALYQSWDYAAQRGVGACAAHRPFLPAMKPLR